MRIAAGAIIPLGLLAVWFQRPLGPDDAPGTVRLSGSCCARTTGAPDYDVWVSSPAGIDGSRVRITFGNLMWGHGAVHGDRADLTYEIWSGTPRTVSPSGRFSDYETQHTSHQATDLRAGDTLTHGPVTIEVIAIHDMILNRNNAIDLRVTFDETRLAEAP